MIFAWRYLSESRDAGCARQPTHRLESAPAAWPSFQSAAFIPTHLVAIAIAFQASQCSRCF
jgi:hypothetical protein